LNAETGETIDKLTHKSGNKVTALRISNGEDKFLVSGDAVKNIVLWKLEDNSVS